LFTSIFQATGSISSCLVADHLLELDERDSDSVSQKEMIKESAATACVGEYHLMEFYWANEIVLWIAGTETVGRKGLVVHLVLTSTRQPVC
jgi:hypothetical protein